MLHSTLGLDGSHSTLECAERAVKVLGGHSEGLPLGSILGRRGQTEGPFSDRGGVTALGERERELSQKRRESLLGWRQQGWAEP